MIVYFNGAFMPKEDVRISPDDRGFTFADGVYEVICAYGGRLFKLEEHLRRMARSLRALRIAGFDVSGVGEVAREVLRRNGLERAEAKLYLHVTRGVAPRQHAFPDEAISPTVYVSAAPYELPEERWARGVRVILVADVRWSRCDIKAVALLPNVLASQRAKGAGAYEALFVREGVVTEGSHTSFCGVFDGVLVTHPLNTRILAGITRGVVLELCRALDIPFRESPIGEGDLHRASELMVLGTTTGIMPVTEVGDWPVGGGRPGPITRKLQRAFREMAVL
jgi:D-alanine transaminase